MAEVILNTNLDEKKWLVNEYLKPYIRMSGLDRYMGRGSDAIIRVFGADVTDGGKTIVIPLVGNIRSQGVSGSQVLVGNETDMDTFVDEIRTNWRRNAVKVPKSSSYKSNLDILRIARPELRNWAANYVLKRGLIDNMQGIVLPGALGTDGFYAADTVVAYADSTAAQRNAFMVANSDRILFGASIANASSGVWATALATIDNTDDKLTTTLISKAREIARATGDMSATGPAITPYMTEDGEEYFVFFAHRRQMRDLRQDPAMVDANKHAMERGKSNPLFRAGDLLWEDVIIREVSDMDLITGAGSGGIDVAQGFLAGQSALAMAWGQEPRLITDNSQDYQFRPAVAIEELIGIKKTSFQGKQYGGVTVVTAAAAAS